MFIPRFWSQAIPFGSPTGVERAPGGEPIPSRSGRSNAIRAMCEMPTGQASSQAPHAVQASSASSETSGVSGRRRCSRARRIGESAPPSRAGGQAWSQRPQALHASSCIRSAQDGDRPSPSARTEPSGRAANRMANGATIMWRRRVNGITAQKQAAVRTCTVRRSCADPAPSSPRVRRACATPAPRGRPESTPRGSSAIREPLGEKARDRDTQEQPEGDPIPRQIEWQTLPASKKTAVHGHAGTQGERATREFSQHGEAPIHRGGQSWRPRTREQLQTGRKQDTREAPEEQPVHQGCTPAPGPDGRLAEHTGRELPQTGRQRDTIDLRGTAHPRPEAQQQTGRAHDQTHRGDQGRQDAPGTPSVARSKPRGRGTPGSGLMTARSPINRTRLGSLVQAWAERRSVFRTRERFAQMRARMTAVIAPRAPGSLAGDWGGNGTTAAWERT